MPDFDELVPVYLSLGKNFDTIKFPLMGGYTHLQRRCALPWKRARVRLLRIAPGRWNSRLGLEDQQCSWSAGDTRFQ